MTAFDEPKTLIRTGRFDGSFISRVRGFREPLTRVLFDFGETINFARFRHRNPYFLVVSQHIGERTDMGPNIVLTVTSYLDERNNLVADRFEIDTGIRLRRGAPESLRGYCKRMIEGFKALERDQQAAMYILKTSSFIKEDDAAGLTRD